jgi:alkylation response protein AidB-like acyl-CoA dehydrogenase
MNFDLEEEQEELRSSVRSVLEQECPLDLARSMYEGGRIPEQPWKSACELGWTSLTTPEAFGGLGLGPVELGLVAEEHGRRLAPGPFLPTLSQLIPSLVEAGSDEQKQRWLEPAAAGQLTGTLAISGEAGGVFGADPSLRARPDGSDWLLDGRRYHVCACGMGTSVTADQVVVVASVDAGDGVGLFLIPGDAARASRVDGLDASRPLVHLEFDALRVPKDSVLGTPGESSRSLERITSQAITAQAFEMVGCSQALFDTTLEYARQREQFGRPIGSFQAIQHKFADMFIDLEKARSTALFAAMTLAEGEAESALAASMAKAAVGECQRRICKEGIQIHGGLGYTWEQDVHLYVKRLKTGEALFGSTADHRERIATLLGV